MGEPAPLFSLPEAPVPEGGAAEWVTGVGGVRLRAALFPAKDAKGSVVLSPGRTETIEKYYEVVDELRARGLTVLVHDWRGQGLSQRLARDPVRGHARGWRPFAQDYSRVVDAFADRLPKPWIAFGHSMGGALTLLALLSGESRFAAALATSPMLGLQLGKRKLSTSLMLARVMNLLGFTEGYLRAPPAGRPAFEGNILTHDRRRWDRTEALLAAYPQLALGEVTWGWIEFALSASVFLATSPAVERLDLPVVLVTSGEETLVDNAATRAFAARLKHGRLVEIAGSRHEILMETDPVRALFWAEFDRLAGTVTP